MCYDCNHDTKIYAIRLSGALQNNPAVALLGARQVGKTTLSLNVTANITRPTVYLDLERPSDSAKLQDPEHFLSQHMDKLVVLDEIQRRPDILPTLRSLIDQRKRAGDKVCQYLLLGSSSRALLQKHIRFPCWSY